MTSFISASTSSRSRTSCRTAELRALDLTDAQPKPSGLEAVAHGAGHQARPSDGVTGFWRGKRVLVTGGGGFIGSWVVEGLLNRGVSRSDVVIPRSATHDLRIPAAANEVAHGCHVVVHLAAPTGGIAFSRAHPASQFRDCTRIDLNMLEAARTAGVSRFITLGNLLAYPAAALSPLEEPCLHDGPIAETHMGVGLAKRNAVALAEMYFREYGLPVVTVLSANAYGPRDRFDPEHAHVIPATILKCFRDEDLVVWGDGSPTRDFLYAADIAEGILLAAERLQAPDYVNLASGSEVSIRELVTLIAELTGFRGQIVYDAARGGGDPRRVASVARADKILGFRPTVELREGLRRTIEWFRENRDGRG